MVTGPHGTIPGMDLAIQVYEHDEARSFANLASAYDKFGRDKEELRMNFPETDIEIQAYMYARLGTRLAGDGHIVLLSVRTVIHDQDRRGTILHEVVFGEVGVAVRRGWACRRPWGTY